jgi:hypothetical protein
MYRAVPRSSTSSDSRTSRFLTSIERSISCSRRSDSSAIARRRVWTPSSSRSPRRSSNASVRTFFALELFFALAARLVHESAAVLGRGAVGVQGFGLEELGAALAGAALLLGAQARPALGQALEKAADGATLPALPGVLARRRH